MTKQLVIFVTNSFWDEPHRGRHHLAEALSKSHTVIWVNRPAAKREKARKGLQQVRDGLYVLHCGRALIPGRIDLRLNLMNRIRLRLLRTALADVRIDGVPSVIWLHDYKAGNFARHFSSRAVSLYYCNDYFGEYAYRRYETDLARQVDHVLATSPKLAEQLRQVRPTTHFVPHGTWGASRAAAYSRKERPTAVGYVGTLRNSIDATVFWHILEDTDLSLIIAGPIIEASPSTRDDFQRILSHPRTTYVGSGTADQIPEILRKIDVCLLPYVSSFRVSHNFPIKTFDYLAAGKPIVATDYFDWPEPYRELISIWHRDAPIGTVLKQAYMNWDEKKYRRARQIAAESTWDHRVCQIGEIIGVPL